MKFTAWALCPPLALFLFYCYELSLHPKDKTWINIGVFSLAWVWIAFCITVVYWIVRIARRAMRDSGPHPRY